MTWYTLRTISGAEKFVANRIISAGFVAHVPEYFAPKRGRGGKPTYFSINPRPLFPTYLFAQLDASFRKEKIETSRIKLRVFRERTLGDEYITLFNQIALDLTAVDGDMEQYRLAKLPKPKEIAVGDLMQILHGAMQGDHVEVLRARKDQILVSFKAERRAGWRPAWINRTSLGRAV